MIAIAQAARSPDFSLAHARSDGTEFSDGESEQFMQTRHGVVALRQTAGSKTPVVFLHGAGLCKEIFRHQLESRIAREHRLIALDFPGHGSSHDALRPERTYSVDGLADVTLEVLERLDIDRAVVVGGSLGGRVALELANRFPGLVGVALTDMPLVARSRGAKPSFRWSALQDLSPARTGYLLAHLVGQAEAAWLARSFQRADANAISRLQAEAEAGGSDASALADPAELPMLILDGESGAPNGAAPYLTAPGAYNERLAEFLARMTRREQEMLDDPPLWYGG